MGVPYAEVIGDPVAHSKSPLLHKFWLEKLGMDGDYRPVRVKPGEVVHYLELRRRDPDWRGCNATMPLKGELYGLLARLGLPELDLSRSFNCAVASSERFEGLPLDLAVIGANTDHNGLIEPFLREGFPTGSLAIAGSGAAARTAVQSFQRNFEDVAILARDRSRAQALADDLCPRARVLPLDSTLPGASLLINASPLGMNGFPPLDLDLAPLPETATVYDLVYNPVETELLRAARARGLRTLDGLTMLIGQAALSFMLFFKRNAPREHDAELRELLMR